jgi:cytochrome oxidase Cu insertion factor (SCO1/SenC/PrrC family)/thiol-disulfide isomerase/thioredoxin
MMLRRALLCVLAAIAAGGGLSPPARADGDPGSDVLVFQNLFVGSDAGVSVAQQAQLGGLLTDAARAGFPIRVAIIANRFDLGAVTALWQKPESYARFLGLELSLSYKQRLLVVMPNGFGFNWPGHGSAPAYRVLGEIPIGTGGSGLLNAAQTGVRSLAAASGVKLSAPARATATGAASSTEPAAPSAVPAGRGKDVRVALIAAIVAALAAIMLGVRYAWRRSRSARPAGPQAHSRRLPLPGRLPTFALGFAAAIALSIVGLAVLGGSGPASSEALATNPELDPGTPLARAAPDFTLTDQFGKQVSLDSFRGKVVILAFNDSECTTICPLTTTAMVQAKQMLGPAAAKVQLLGVDADPAATSLEDVRSYSEVHGMMSQWRFVTGSLAQLRRVWKAYAVEADVEHGLISHTPALFMIDPEGREAKLYMTQQSYAAVGQLAQILAQEASKLLPSHPRVRSNLSYAQISGISPGVRTSVPRAGGGTVQLGPGGSPRLFLFFATWDQEVTSLAGQLDALDAYQAQAARSGLPKLTAVDEGSVEPSRSAVTTFLAGLPQSLSYPVAIDQSGRIADGYEVQGEPWFVVASPTGRILWYWEVSTGGWLSRGALVQHVRAALARAPKAPASPAVAAQELANSPVPLAALHRQADQLLGSEPALAARIRALRGFPVVVNAWASWCTPCRSEFGLFAVASAHYGRDVAFLGADTDDSAGDARAFLAQHPVSYPSYQTSTTSLGSLAVIEGLPTTIFIDRAGRVAYVHTGQYDSQGSLDEDIYNYGLG